MLNQIALLIPVFFGIAMLEWAITLKRGKSLFTKESTVMNMTLGAIDQIFSIADFILLFIALSYTYNHFHLFEFENNWVQWVAAYVAVDFVSYWYHRFSHRVNLLWAGHITHHSGDHFNYTNGFRGSPFQGLGRIPFWVVLPVIGFDPLILVVTLQISGIYDFWLHTQSIPKLGVLEKVLITPSLHRVHHGKNDIYIDKNYGSTFLIWDQIFGTYQKETEPVLYGIKAEDYVDDEPVKAITFHYKYLWNAFKYSKNKWKALKLIFMPPEWKPDDIEVTSEKSNHAHPEVHKHPEMQTLAYFQLVYGSVGLVALLYVKNLLPFSQFAVLALVVLSAMVLSARLITGNVGAGFKTHGYALYLTEILLLCGQIYVFSNWWMLIPLVLVLLTTALHARAVSAISAIHAK